MDKSTAELCTTEGCVASSVAQNIRTLISRVLDAEDPIDLAMEEAWATSVLLAMFESFGVPLDAPGRNPEVFQPIVERIAGELGLIGTVVIETPRAVRTGRDGH